MRRTRLPLTREGPLCASTDARATSLKRSHGFYETPFPSTRDSSLRDFSTRSSSGQDARGVREEVTRTAGCFKRRVSELAARPSRRFVEGAAACSPRPCSSRAGGPWRRSFSRSSGTLVCRRRWSSRTIIAGARRTRAAWKIQPGARVDTDAASPGSSESRYAWGFPAWNLATGRHPRGRHRLHGHFATINLALSALFAGRRARHISGVVRPQPAGAHADGSRARRLGDGGR